LELLKILSLQFLFAPCFPGDPIGFSVAPSWLVPRMGRMRCGHSDVDWDGLDP